jgi:hypothetical protein
MNKLNSYHLFFVKAFTLGILFLLLFDFTSICQNALWAKYVGQKAGYDINYPYVFHIDTANNSYYISQIDRKPLEITKFNSSGSLDFKLTFDTVNQDFFFETDKSGIDVLQTFVNIDYDQNLYFYGIFCGLFTPNPDSPEFKIVADTFKIFICKYDKNGKFIWINTIDTITNSYDINELSTCFDSSGNIYLSNLLPLTHIDDYTIKVDPSKNSTIKINKEGKIIWRKPFYGLYQIQNNTIFRLKGDNYNYIWGISNFPIKISYDSITISKIDTNGKSLKSKLIIKGNFDSICWPTSYKPYIGCEFKIRDKYILISGYYWGKLDFNFGNSNPVYLSNSTILDVSSHHFKEPLFKPFIALYDTAFNFIWVKETKQTDAFFSTDSNFIFGINYKSLTAYDYNGNVRFDWPFKNYLPLYELILFNKNNFFIAGELEKDQTFYSNKGNFELKYGYGNNIFLARYLMDTFYLSLPHSIKPSKVTIYPNPANNSIFISGVENNATIIIYNLDGREMTNKIIRSGEEIDISFLKSGMYMIKLIYDNNLDFCKLIVN